MDILLMILGCRPSSPGERRVIMALVRIGIALGSASMLYQGYLIESPDAGFQKGPGYTLLLVTILIPIIIRLVTHFIDERF